MDAAWDRMLAAADDSTSGSTSTVDRHWKKHVRSQFESADRDNDGQLTREEWKEQFGTEQGFEECDANHDGVVDAEEFAKVMVWQRASTYKDSPEEKVAEINDPHQAYKELAASARASGRALSGPGSEEPPAPSPPAESEPPTDTPAPAPTDETKEEEGAVTEEDAGAALVRQLFKQRKAAGESQRELLTAAYQGLGVIRGKKPEKLPQQSRSPQHSSTSPTGTAEAKRDTESAFKSAMRNILGPALQSALKQKAAP